MSGVMAGTVGARCAALSGVTEKQFQAQVIQLAKVLRWKVQFHWRSFHSPAGWPDLTLVRADRIIHAELKTVKGKVSEAQQEWLDVLAATGKCEVYVWRPADFDVITDILR